MDNLGTGMNDSGATIDVLLVTYNHERYIAQALASIFSQKHARTMRIVVADDCSSDSTVAIVREHAQRHPNVECLFLDAPRNLGISANYQRGFAACRAEYVAVLEGDDYWCSPHKLRKQSAWLDDHRECVMCGCNYFVFDEHRSTLVARVALAEGGDLLDSRSLIHDNVIGTFSTCMYRRHVLQLIPAELYAMTTYDWGLNICVGTHGLIGFLKEGLAVYRVHREGLWNKLSHEDKIEAQLALIPEYDRLTNGVHRQEFAALKTRLTTTQIIHTGQRIGVRGQLRRAKALLRRAAGRRHE